MNTGQNDRDSEGTNLLQGVMQLLPVLTLVVTTLGAWFNLQGQVNDLRTRYESSTAVTKESLSDMKTDIRENSVLLRQLLQDRKHTPKG